MIKIIKQGKKPERILRKWTVTCNLCGCVFECDISDFERRDMCLYGNGYVRCPTCQQLITIENLYNHKE